MDILTIAVVFFLTWWTVLFAVLPWGNRFSDTPQTGTPGSAPIEHNMKKKALITTILAFVLTGMIYALVETNVISFHDMARQMTEEDQARR